MYSAEPANARYPPLMAKVANVFLRKMLTDATFRQITPEALAAYRAPYTSMASLNAVARWPREIPIDGVPADNHATMAAYHDWLGKTGLPKLMMYTKEGAILNGEALEWCLQLENLTSVDLGDGIHFVQETCPHRIGFELSSWYAGL